jgi:hypothetical protein
MKRAGLPSYKRILALLGLIAGLLVSLLAPVAQAATLLTLMTSSCSSYTASTITVVYEPITIPLPAVVQSVTLQLISGTATGAKIDIYSDSSGSPSSTLLGSLTYSSASSPYVTLTGNVSLSSAGRYWFKFSTTTTYRLCYTSTPFTAGSLSGWSVGKMSESFNSGSTFATRTDDVTFLMNISGTGGSNIQSILTLGAPSSGSYRRPMTISANLGIAGSDGRLTFFANGKRIPKCIGVQSTALVASCTWSPNLKGAIMLSATLTPADTLYIPTTSPQLKVDVAARANLR